MPENLIKDKFTLIGKVIEMYEKDRINFVKIKYDDGIIDISTDKLKDFHLGDRVTIKTSIDIQSIDNEISDIN